jgi:hypothetical protein
MVTIASSHSFLRWWPEIPVILAIFLATILMGTLCYHFFTNEKRNNQYASSGARRSTKVFKQSCWFVIAFYITWVPYITLQACEAQNSYCILSLILLILMFRCCTFLHLNCSTCCRLAKDMTISGSFSALQPWYLSKAFGTLLFTFARGT